MIYMTRTHKLIAAAVLIVVVMISGTVYIKQEKATEINLGKTAEPEEAAVSPVAVKTEAVPAQISVYICGSVKNPGVITLTEGSRLEEAVDLAGGAAEKADLTAVNLAYKLSDEDMVYIPELGEKPVETAGAAVKSSAGTVKKGSAGSGKVNINTAGESELDTLDGIGPATARAIIAYRNQVGAFSSIEQIKEVKGIGDAKYSGIKDDITVD